MMRPSSYVPTLLMLSTSLLLVGGCAEEQSYPHRPITLTCPWAAGGGTDRVSRQVAAHLEQELGVPVNVVNATGGSGVTGHSRALHARPDGYTVGMATVELNMLHWRELTAISYEDALPLMSVNEDAAALFVSADAPWQNLAELTAAIEANQGEMTASGTSTGGIWHLALAGWLDAVGLGADAVKWVPEKGAHPSLQLLASGGVDMVCCSLPEADSLLDAGVVRPLGVMAEKRVAGYEDVPTFKEQGVDWVLVGWRGLVLPKGTPASVRDKLVGALKQIVQGETKVAGQTFPEFMEKQGFDHTWRPPEEFQQFLAANDEKFGKLLKNPAMSSVSESRIGPMVFPTVIGAALVLALGAVFVESRWSQNEKREGFGTVTRLGGLRIFLVAAALVGYILLAETVGFLLTAGVAMLVLLVAFDGRPVRDVLVTLVFVPAVYHLFVHLLGVPLPTGMLGW